MNRILNGRTDVTAQQTHAAWELVQEIEKREKNAQQARGMQQVTPAKIRTVLQSESSMDTKEEVVPAKPPAPLQRVAKKPVRLRSTAGREKKTRVSTVENNLALGEEIYECLQSLLEKKYGALLTRDYPGVKDFCFALTKETRSPVVRDGLVRLLQTIDDQFFKITLRNHFSTIFMVRKILEEADQRKLAAEFTEED